MIPDWLTFEAVLAYSLQFAAVGLLGLLLPDILRIRDSEARVSAWHFALGAALVFPLLGRPFFQGESSHPAAWSFSVDAAAAAAPAAARLTAVHLLIAGAALMVAWRGLGLLRLRSLGRSAEPLELVDVMRGETLTLHRRLFRGVEPHYLRSDRIASPLVYGVFRPIVLLPDSFFGLPENQRRAVLVHELLHIQRNDWLDLLWLELWRCVLWFHPVIHLISQRVAVAREQLVDRKAIELTADRRSYVDALVAIARSPAPSDRLLAPLFLEKNRLKQRIQIILEEKPMPALKRYAWLAVIAVALFLAADWARDSFPVYAQNDGPTIYKVGDDGVSAPSLLEKVEPQFPDGEGEAGFEGTVVLSCEVHPDGRAHNIRVVEGLKKSFNDKAIEAIESWRFKPASRAGKPVAVSATVEVNFKKL